MAAAPAPRKTDTPTALSAALLLLPCQLCVVVVFVFEVARGAWRPAAGTLTLANRLQLVRFLCLTAIVL